MTSLTALPHDVDRRPAPVIILDGVGGFVPALEQTLKSHGAAVAWRGKEDPEHLDSVQADLVVLIAAIAAPASRASAWSRQGAPVLPLVYDERSVTVGPVQLPGVACLRCMDLHRADRDPAWPTVLSHLSPQHPHLRPDSSLLALGSGLTALVARRLLSHRSVQPGVSLEIDLDVPQIVPRRWMLHPRCGCDDARETMAT